MRRRHVVPIMALSLALLAGCSSSGVGIERLDQLATPKDDLPPVTAVFGFQPGTTRYLAQQGGFSFYLARPSFVDHAGTLPPGWGVCLIVVEPETISCGLMPLEMPLLGISAQLVPDDFDASDLTSDGWDQVQRNLFLKGMDHSSRKPPRHPETDESP